MRLNSFAAFLLGSASAIAFPSAVLAQQVPAQAAETAPGVAQVDVDEADEAQDTGPAASAVDNGEIVVTGSRTIRNGNNSPTPVTVVSTESLQNARPTSLTESIQIMPVFSGGRSQTSNATATGAVGGGNGTAAQLNLRNIGAQRNLVLMDGRRVPPTSFTNIVDADVIPQLLIKRVDVVTGGVSAVYGSDAVTGVINFITDTTFEGLRVQGQAGISERGDDGSQELGVAWGRRFGDRSHFEISYEYRNNDGILRRSDRDWYTRPVVIGNGTTIPYRSIENATLSAQPFGGRITCTGGCAITGQYFATDGVLAPFVNGTVYTGTTTQSGGAGGYLDNSLKAAQRSHQLFARFDTEITDDISLFVSGSANFKKNLFFADDLILSNVVLRRDNAFLPAIYQNQLRTPTFTYSQIFNQDARLRIEPNTRQLTFVAGLEGTLGDYSWEAAYVHGDSRLKTQLSNNPNQQKLSAALDAVTNASGQVVCFAATQAATAAAYADCAPLNLFGPTASSAAARDYIFDDTRYVARTKQDNVTASISGTPLSTWAGPLTVALSGEWRTQSFRATSDGRPDQFADCTSLRHNCVATGSRTLLLRNTFASSPKISDDVWEAAVEANVPLVKDVPFIEAFEVNAAARYTHYTSVGNYTTWKLGANWIANDAVRFRGTISRDIRAPTLNDLYAPELFNVDNIQDLLNGITVQATQRNLSNPNLSAEIGSTKTAGIVLTPGFLPGLSLAVDYYSIKIDDAIVSLQGSQAIIQNGCNLSGIALYCDLIERDASGRLINVITRPVNLAKITTSGVDFELNYQGRLFGRQLMLRGLAAYQPHIRFIQPDVPTIDQGGVAFGASGITASPKWRLTGFLSYQLTDSLRLDILQRWRSSLKLTGDPTLAFVPGDNKIRAYAQTALNVAFTVNRDAELFLNIQNLFDADPPLGNAPGTAAQAGSRGGFATTDDVVGRYFTFGARLKY